MNKQQLEIAALREENMRLRRQLSQQMEAGAIERFLLAALTGVAGNKGFTPDEAAKRAIDVANATLNLLASEGAAMEEQQPEKPAEPVVPQPKSAIEVVS